MNIANFLKKMNIANGRKKNPHPMLKKEKETKGIRMIYQCRSPKK